MSNRKGKSIDSLMKHIRDQHNISINGSADKKKLINMGYYHGYKGYRFNKNIDNMFEGINDFDQIVVIANFDQQMKAIFYPIVMNFETVMKNIIVSQVVRDIDPSFDNVYRKKLTDYRSLSPRINRRAYKNAVDQRLRLKRTFDGKIADSFHSDNRLIKHYIETNQPVPLWALFEVISLGNVGQFVSTLNADDRIEIAKYFNLYSQQFDPNAKILKQSIYLIKELRNAIAHNHIIFDCRFKKQERISNNMVHTIQQKLNINGAPTFNSLFDYLALLIIYLNESGATKTILNSYISSFKKSIDELYQSTKINSRKEKVPLPYAIYNAIIGEDVNNKLKKLKDYIAS